MSLLSALIPTHFGLTRRNGTATPTDLENAIRPAYEIKETPEAWGLTVYLPGVDKDGLELTAEEDSLRIVGKRAWKRPEGWTSVFRESVDAPFELVLSHDNAVNVDAIAAELRNGVLRVSLPKQEALKPRKIAVK